MRHRACGRWCRRSISGATRAHFQKIVNQWPIHMTTTSAASGERVVGSPCPADPLNGSSARCGSAPLPATPPSPLPFLQSPRPPRPPLPRRRASALAAGEAGERNGWVCTTTAHRRRHERGSNGIGRAWEGDVSGGTSAPVTRGVGDGAEIWGGGGSRNKVQTGPTVNPRGKTSIRDTVCQGRDALSCRGLGHTDMKEGDGVGGS